MNDISLDDLIKKDKDSSKMQFLKNKLIKRKQHFEGNVSRNEGRGNKNFNRQEDERPFKNKFIKKEFDQNRRRQREDREEPERKFKPKHQSNNEAQQKDLHFRTLKVLGLSPDITNEDLYKLFAAEGALEKCLIEQDNFGRNLPTALVKYYDHDHAKNAIQNINRHKILNCILTVEPYKNTKNN